VIDVSGDVGAMSHSQPETPTGSGRLPPPTANVPFVVDNVVRPEQPREQSYQKRPAGHSQICCTASDDAEHVPLR
jgi:hypothetical protein